MAGLIITNQQMYDLIGDKVYENWNKKKDLLHRILDKLDLVEHNEKMMN